jgi:hypothetical protein
MCCRCRRLATGSLLDRSNLTSQHWELKMALQADEVFTLLMPERASAGLPGC